MTIDERLEALAMNLEVAFRDIQELKELARKDGENIRALARVQRFITSALQISKAGTHKSRLLQHRYIPFKNEPDRFFLLRWHRDV